MSGSFTGPGGPRIRQIPEGDDRERMVCPDCGFIVYDNPKIVVGAVVTHGDQFLMCKRAIEPRKGYWTFPAGFMELGETAEQGAAREAVEEAQCSIVIKDLLAVYSIPRIHQVHLIFRATLPNPIFAPGPESLEVRLMTWDEIPWNDLAFPNIHWSLRHFDEAKGQDVIVPRGVPEDWAGRS